jgi:hypothetical protein
MPRTLLCCCLILLPAVALAEGEQEDGFRPLFNGQDLSGWTPPEGDNGHWRVVDGVIDYDAASESTQQDKNLWSNEEFGDFILKLDWRIKETPSLYDVPVVLQDGSYLDDPVGNGKPLTIKMPNADSGIYLRGTGKAQVNIWCWPIGSGEVYGYRHSDENAPDVRAGVTPRVNADHLTVIENNQMVLENAHLPGVPEQGKLALQHHGGRNADGTYKPASSLVQFRNIWIKELTSR